MNRSWTIGFPPNLSTTAPQKRNPSPMITICVEVKMAIVEYESFRLSIMKTV